MASCFRRPQGAGFDVVLTKDQGIEYEQNLDNLPVSVILIAAKTNKLDDILPLVPGILNVLSSITPRSLVKVP